MTENREQSTASYVLNDVNHENAMKNEKETFHGKLRNG
jgi:hypothetical protein